MQIFLQRAILLFIPVISAYPQPEACSGWCFKDLRDPNVVVKNGTYYRFATHHNLTISTAPSLAGPWEKQGSALHNGTMISMPLKHPEKNGDHQTEDEPPMLWAPDVFLIDDTYYMTYTATRGGRPNEIGIATSKTLEPGSWTDHGSICLPESEKSNRVDSNLFQSAPGGVPLLNFGSYLRGLFQVPLTLPPLELNGKVVETVHNESNVAIEAAYQFQWTVGGKPWYYLFFSSGRCCNPPAKLPSEGDEYKTMVCRSDSPTGPFVDDADKPCVESGGRMVLGSHGDVYGPGGQGVLYDEQLKSPVMYYHYMSKSTGYKVEDVYFGWNKLEFDSGWPVLVGKEDDEDGPGKPRPSSSVSMRVEVATTTVTLCLSALLLTTVAAMR